MYHLVRCLFSGAPEKVEKVSGDNEGGRKEGTISRGARRANNRTKTPYTNDTFCISISILRYLTLALMVNNKRKAPLKDNDIFAFIFRKLPLHFYINLIIHIQNPGKRSH